MPSSTMSDDDRLPSVLESRIAMTINAGLLRLVDHWWRSIRTTQAEWSDPTKVASLSIERDLEAIEACKADMNAARLSVWNLCFEEMRGVLMTRCVVS